MKKKIPDHQLRLVVVKIGLSQAEAAALAARRGHNSRAAFCRAAALGAELAAAPSEALALTWASSARVQSSLTQINLIAHHLNSIVLESGQDSSALQLLASSDQVLSLFKTFRASILESQSGA